MTGLPKGYAAPRLLRLSRNVADLARAVAFYRDALGFDLIAQTRLTDPAWSEALGMPGACATSAMLQLGEQTLELLAFDSPGRPYPADSTSADCWFQHVAIVVADMPVAYAQLCRHVFVPISRHGPQQLPANTGSVSAFKFRDPDGHPLELIHFPPGIGDPCWQQRRALFLGIDHSAVAVADAERSLAFYSQWLGLHASARSCNQGSAQQQLDDLADVQVDVLALQSMRTHTPHVELLGYRTPRGRACAAGTMPHDSVADRLLWQVDDVPAWSERLARAQVEGLSPRTSVLANGRQLLLLRDPDGHLLQIESAAAG